MGGSPQFNAKNNTLSRDSGGRKLDEAWRRHTLRPPLSRLQAAEFEAPAGFHPQLHAAAAIAAQTGLAYRQLVESTAAAMKQ